jgi:hypothetical protein
MMKEEREPTSSGSGSGDLSSSAIKLFGKTIAVSGGADSVSVSASVSTKVGDCSFLFFFLFRYLVLVGGRLVFLVEFRIEC